MSDEPRYELRAMLTEGELHNLVQWGSQAFAAAARETLAKIPRKVTLTIEVSESEFNRLREESLAIGYSEAYSQCVIAARAKDSR